jgi:hypothetical protein
MFQTVILAPVPCIHLHSASAVPGLCDRVAFGSNQRGVPDLPIGARVFIYASDPQTASKEALRLFKPGYASWTGHLGAIVRAVKGGRRDGKHPDPLVRPPTAEEGDTHFMYFWEVLGLRPLRPQRPLRDFAGTLAKGGVPKWPARAELEFSEEQWARHERNPS